ncbi:MAG: hypothetical protein M3N46_02610 [Actinomycetota bacterium]|nr:hypothetical protein [Actinomycetota bacterium]
MSAEPGPHPSRWDDQRDNLLNVRGALTRGTRRSRLTLTKAVCPKNHTLADVFRGTDGALYAAFTTTRVADLRFPVVDRIDSERPREIRGMPLLGQLFGPSCPCRREWNVTRAEIHQAIEDNRKRFVVGSEHNPTRRVYLRIDTATQDT